MDFGTCLNPVNSPKELTLIERKNENCKANSFQSKGFTSTGPSQIVIPWCMTALYFGGKIMSFYITIENKS